VYAEEFLAKSLNAQPEAVSKRLEQDRAEAQEIFHKVRGSCAYCAVFRSACWTSCVFEVIK
jgi:hypothetical protein